MKQLPHQLYNGEPLKINEDVRFLIFQIYEPIDNDVTLALIVNGLPRCAPRRWIYYNKVVPRGQNLTKWIVHENNENNIPDNCGLYCFCLHINMPNTGSCYIETLDLKWSDGNTRKTKVYYDKELKGRVKKLSKIET